MTDRVNPSPGHTPDEVAMGRTLQYASSIDAWILPSDQLLLADRYPDLAGGPYSAFTYSHSDSSLDVSFQSGEAMVRGAAIARDVETTVTLDASTANQTIYLGWLPSATNVVEIGKDSDLPAEAPRTPLATFDTDGSGVTSHSDHRKVGRRIDVHNTQYDEDRSGVVDNAEALNGKTADDLGTAVSENGAQVTDTANDLNFRQGMAAESDGDGGVNIYPETKLANIQGWYSSGEARGWNFVVPDGKTCYVWGMGVIRQTSVPSDVYIEIYEPQLDSPHVAYNRTYTEDLPIISLDGPRGLEVRINNESGSGYDLGGFAYFSLE